MVGLTIIVILIIFVGLFALRFMFSKGHDEPDEFYSVKANNLMNTLKQVSVCDKNFEKAMIACCEGGVFCGQSACEFVDEFVVGIMNKTVDENYYFELKNEDEFCTFLGECGQGISSSTVFLRSETGVYNSRVVLCLE